MGLNFHQPNNIFPKPITSPTKPIPVSTLKSLFHRKFPFPEIRYPPFDSPFDRPWPPLRPTISGADPTTSLATQTRTWPSPPYPVRTTPCNSDSGLRRTVPHRSTSHSLRITPYFARKCYRARLTQIQDQKFTTMTPDPDFRNPSLAVKFSMMENLVRTLQNEYQMEEQASRIPPICFFDF